MSGTYLIIGGAGRTGRRVVDLLTGLGHGVVIASRHPRQARAARARTVAVDLAENADPALLDGIDGVVISVEPPVDTSGAEALLDRGVDRLARVAAKPGAQIILISQIYVTRADEHPDMAGIINARAAGERALRVSGAPYTIIRPSWLTDRPATGVRLEQGDTGDGRISRDTVAAAVVAALFCPASRGKSFELYDDPYGPSIDWETAFAGLADDEG
jgi:uncharacterized protein YbjT (DUF2867 family)